MKVDYQQTIEISAPTDLVWEVLSDVERWPEWTRSVRSAHVLEEGGLRPGGRVVLRQPRLPTATWTVEKVEPGRQFSWRSEAAGLASLGEHAVEATAADASRAVLRLTHVGTLAGPVRLVYGSLIRRYVRLEAEGLKREAEARRALS